jgi:hypothetical protein
MWRPGVRVALHQFLGFPKLVEALRDAVDAIDTDVSTTIVSSIP